jgi:hypothetical protein
MRQHVELRLGQLERDLAYYVRSVNARSIGG